MTPIDPLWAARQNQRFDARGSTRLHPDTQRALDDQRLAEDAAELEVGRGGLQEFIRKRCREKWPEWPVIQCRADQKSTIEKGANDLTIFCPGGPLLVETKARGKKPTPDQLQWAKKLEMVGFKVHFVWSESQWLELENSLTPKS